MSKKPFTLKLLLVGYLVVLIRKTTIILKYMIVVMSIVKKNYQMLY